MLKQLTDKVLPSKHLIGVERHKDGGKHIHVLLESSTKFSIERANPLEIDFQGKSYHGNYQPVRNLKGVAEYVAKHGDVIHNFPNLVNGHFMTMQEDLAKTAVEQGSAEATHKLMTTYINQALRGLNAANAPKMLAAVEQHFAQHQAQSQSKGLLVQDTAPPIQLDQLDLSEQHKLVINQWLINRQPTLIIVGPAGYGKTLLGWLLIEKLGLKALFVNHPEGLKGLQKDHQVIFFDDPSFEEMSLSQLLALFQTDQDHKQIRVLRDCVSRPKGMTQIITMNYQALLSLKKKFKNDQLARRMIILNIDRPIVNVNLNIHVQMHADIFNNPENIRSNQAFLDSLKK